MHRFRHIFCAEAVFLYIFVLQSLLSDEAVGEIYENKGVMQTGTPT